MTRIAMHDPWIELRALRPGGGESDSRVLLRRSTIIRVTEGRAGERAGCCLVTRDPLNRSGHSVVVIDRYQDVAQLLMIAEPEAWVEVTTITSAAESGYVTARVLVRIATILRLDDAHDFQHRPAASQMIVEDAKGTVGAWLLSLMDPYWRVVEALRKVAPETAQAER